MSQEFAQWLVDRVPEFDEKILASIKVPPPIFAAPEIGILEIQRVATLNKVRTISETSVNRKVVVSMERPKKHKTKFWTASWP